MNDNFQTAYVLHVRHYRETSGLVDFMTHDSGRLSLLAKGYKRQGKSAKSFLQPFRKLSITWRGRGELKTLAAAEELAGPVNLEGQSLISGLYINELITRLLQPMDPHPELFELYEQTISLLSNPLNLESVLRLFERNVLDVMGYGLQLTANSDGEEIEEDVDYCYVVDQGAVKSNKVLQNGIMLKGKTLLSLNASDMMDPEVLKESKNLMRYVLSHHVGNKPLKTRDLFRYY